VRRPPRSPEGPKKSHDRREPRGGVMSSLLAGRVQTVLGSIGAEEVGITLPHEHLLI